MKYNFEPTVFDTELFNELSQLNLPFDYLGNRPVVVKGNDGVSITNLENYSLELRKLVVYRADSIYFKLKAKLQLDEYDYLDFKLNNQGLSNIEFLNLVK